MMHVGFFFDDLDNDSIILALRLSAVCASHSIYYYIVYRRSRSRVIVV